MILRTRDLNYWGEMNSFRQVFVQSRTREVIDDLDFEERAGGRGILAGSHQLSRTPQGSIGLRTTCFAYPFAGCKGVDDEFRPTPSSLQRGQHHGLTACDHDRVLVMG